MNATQPNWDALRTSCALLFGLCIWATAALADDLVEQIDGVPLGHTLIEGDIILPPWAGRASYGGVQWTGGIVPFVYDPNVTPANQVRARSAMDEWEARADVSFIPRTTQPDYLVIRDAGVNSSYIGTIGGPQNLNISAWTHPDVIMHELGHAYGFWHEMCRADRDHYVRINYGNIQAGYSFTFDIRDSGGDPGFYDFASIMHYPGCAFSTCGSICPENCVTIEARPQYAYWQNSMGDALVISPADAAGMAFVYGFSGPDCNANHIRDGFELSRNLTPDCDSNGIPDDCEADCNANRRADSCDIAAGTLLDVNTNGAPDPCEGAAAVLYVDADAAGANTGLSWADALTDLQSAFALAHSAPGLVAEIWVAEGNYAPAGPGGPRESYFELRDRLALYGGFAGYETDREQRDPAHQLTVLDGDLNGDDGPAFTNRADNVCNVLYAGPEIGPDALLDGFTIRGGNADGTCGAFSDAGAGLHCLLCDMQVRNCQFEDNSTFAMGAGAAMYVFWSNPIVDRCVFKGNRAAIGGAVYNDGGYPRFSNSLFTQNAATVLHGGGLISRVGTAWILNCTFYANTALGTNAKGGGLAVFFNGTMSVHNSISWGNTDSFGTGESAQVGAVGRPVGLQRTCVQGLTGALGGVGNTATDPQFVNAAGGDLRLLGSSPCVDVGSTGLIPREFAPERDLDGHARILCGGVDMGAYESGFGDHDCDGDLDLTDWLAWPACMTGPDAGPYVPGCEAFDAEFDTDVDLRDFAALMRQQ